MKLKNLKKTITDFRGREIRFAFNENKSMSIGEAIANIASSGYKGVTAKESINLYKLAIEIDGKEEIDINANMVSSINKAIENNQIGFTPIIIGQILIETGLEVK